jgi:hypothetical protein
MNGLYAAPMSERAFGRDVFLSQGGFCSEMRVSMLKIENLRANTGCRPKRRSETSLAGRVG